jgi:hypothetical protein
MMRATAIVLTVAALCLGSGSAQAITGNDLRRECDQPDKSPAALYCLAYETGVLDAMRGLDSVATQKQLCEPTGVTGEQLYAMLKKYLADHPERLHYLASSLIEDMYAENFGCSKAP